MKPIEGYNKLRGGYYTPDKISEFITDWAVKAAADTILEPSCGDGSFECNYTPLKNTGSDKARGQEKCYWR